MNTRAGRTPGVSRAVVLRVSLLIVISAALPLMTAYPPLLSQDLGAATRPLPDLRVLLMWSADTLNGSPVRYNIYRKPASSTAYPGTPLTTSPIGPITDTVQFKTIIPRGSDEWNFISYALADSMGGRNPVQPLTNVFAITTYPRGSRNWLRVQMLVAVRPSVALVMGQAYTDMSVVNGTAYKYKVLRVNSGGTQLPPTGANEVTITAGVPAPIPVPSSVRIVVGDAKLQILWSKPLPQFSGFNVYRSSNPIGPYRLVNDVEYSADVSRDIDSVAVSPAANGFTDYERWDTSGNPLPRTVPGNPLPFTGPANGVPYWYKVAHKDILGNVGTLSTQVSGTPVDKTPPATPQDIFVEAIESNSSFRIRWSKVRLDIDGHRENVVSYTVYRYARADNPSLGAAAVPPAIPQPGPLDSTQILAKDDSTLGLRSACTDSTLYFRVEAVDAWGNISRRSIAVGAALKDTTRPAVVKGTAAEGYDDYIRVKWTLNTDCGVDAYLIYRSLCDRGKWYPCLPAVGKGRLMDQPAAASNDKKRGDCGGSFALVGVVPQSLAKALGGGTAYFDDHSVPAGSPLCYAYLVKAQDHSQNISGTLPIPAVPPEIIVCQRLRDRTPPEPAIIAGLFARDSAIQVDYIGPPVQDIAAYHIYRSDSSQFGTYAWVGGMTVVPPPGVGMPLAAPYIAPSHVACDSIPLVSNPYMSAGTFFDRHVDRKHIYWYKVLGVDRAGNQSLPDSALAISTFTFASGRETPPQIVSVIATDNPCALTLNWTPVYDTTRVRGFLVFRSTSPAGQYFQLEGLQKSNAFADPSVARSTTYFYRVVALRRDGMLTAMSDPKSGLHP
jgi:hypothetical protein